MPFLLTQLGFPKVRHGGAEYDPYDSDSEDEGTNPRLPKQVDQVKSESKKGGALLTLDEISVHKPGVDVHKLIAQAKLWGFTWALVILGCLVDPVLFEARILLPPEQVGHVPKIRPTQRRYLPHLKKMANTWHCLAQVSAVPRAIGSYFEVRKKDSTARTVIDCRPLNAMCKTPQKVNLCNIADFLMSVASLGSCWFIVGDFRQWYWQLRVPKAVRDLFGISVLGLFFCAVSVPMGWSHSALFAQVCLLTIILMRPPRAPDQSDDEWYLGLDGASFGSQMPPGILQLKGKRGFIAGYYDNTCVATRNQFDAGLWRKRILGNAASVRAVWNPEEVLSVPARSAVFLGVLIEGSGPVRWRHCLRKMDKWIRWWTEPWPVDGSPPIIHARWVAKAVGIIVCDANIRLIPLFDIADCVEALKYIHEHYELKRKRDWFQTVVLPEKLLRNISSRMEVIMKNEWHSPKLSETASVPWVAASDASDFAWGFVILRGPDGTPIVSGENSASPGLSFPKNLRDACIFIKEMYAALKTVTHVAALNRGRHFIELTLLMDNTAAMHCIRNWYSKNAAGNRILKRIYAILREANITIRVVWIGTDDNPADEPSRLRKIVGCKCLRALDFCDGVWAYTHEGRERRKKWNDVQDATTADEKLASEVCNEDDREALDELHEGMLSCHPADLPDDEATRAFEQIETELSF